MPYLCLQRHAKLSNGKLTQDRKAIEGRNEIMGKWNNKRKERGVREGMRRRIGGDYQGDDDDDERN